MVGAVQRNPGDGLGAGQRSWRAGSVSDRRPRRHRQKLRSLTLPARQRPRTQAGTHPGHACVHGPGAGERAGGPGGRAGGRVRPRRHPVPPADCRTGEHGRRLRPAGRERGGSPTDRPGEDVPRPPQPGRPAGERGGGGGGGDGLPIERGGAGEAGGGGAGAGGGGEGEAGASSHRRAEAAAADRGGSGRRGASDHGWRAGVRVHTGGGGEAAALDKPDEALERSVGAVDVQVQGIGGHVRRLPSFRRCFFRAGPAATRSPGDR